MTTEGPSSAGERKPRRRGRAWFCLILEVFSLVVSGLAARVLVLTLDRRPLLRRDPVTGWGLRSNLDQVRTYRGGAFTISTDPLGRRRSAPAGSSPAGPSIVVVGDSFARDWGVADQETFVWVLGDRAGRRVVNLGVLGFESAQELAALRRYLAERPDEEIGDVILLVFDNDLLDCQLPFDPAIGRTRPQLGDESCSPAWVDVAMDASRMYWLVHGALARFRGSPWESPAGGLESVSTCVRRMGELAASRGARIHVLAYRRLSEPDVSDAVWQELLERCQAEDLTPGIRSAGGEAPIGFDGLHWNAAGHGVVAARLLELLDEPPAWLGEALNAARAALPRSRRHACSDRFGETLSTRHGCVGEGATSLAARGSAVAAPCTCLYSCRPSHAGGHPRRRSRNGVVGSESRPTRAKGRRRQTGDPPARPGSADRDGTRRRARLSAVTSRHARAPGPHGAMQPCAPSLIRACRASRVDCGTADSSTRDPAPSAGR